MKEGDLTKLINKQIQGLRSYDLRSHTFILLYYGVDKPFSLEGWMVNILGFSDHLVSPAIIQLCYCSTKAARDYW